VGWYVFKKQPAVVNTMYFMLIQTYLGAGSDTSAHATFTYYAADETERIIALESLGDQITSVQCSGNSISLQIDDASVFEQVYNLWGWTNNHDNNTVIVVAGSGQCGSNEDRVPFNISSIDYQNATNTAVLSGTQVDWTDVASNYDLHISSSAQPGLSRRDYKDNWNLDFNHELGFGNWTFPIDKTYSVGLTCKTCYTTGSFDFDFDIVTRLFIPVDATLTLKPNNVSAVVDPTISLSGNIGSSLSFKDKFLAIPIDGIAIGSIINLGPEIAFTGALTIGPVKGTASLTTGVTVSLQDSAEVYIDVLHPSKFTASGWSPKITEKTPTISASISAGISLGVLADVEFDISVFGKKTQAID